MMYSNRSGGLVFPSRTWYQPGVKMTAAFICCSFVVIDVKTYSTPEVAVQRVRLLPVIAQYLHGTTPRRKVRTQIAVISLQMSSRRKSAAILLSDYYCCWS